MSTLFKWLSIPSGSTEVRAVQLWEVRWMSRHGEFRTDTKPQVEAFISEDEAESFAAALRAAFKLIRATSGTNVAVKKVA